MIERNLGSQKTVPCPLMFASMHLTFTYRKMAWGKTGQLLRTEKMLKGQGVSLPATEKANISFSSGLISVTKDC